MRGSRRRRMHRHQASTQSINTTSCREDGDILVARGEGGAGGGPFELRHSYFAPLHEVFLHASFISCFLPSPQIFYVYTSSSPPPRMSLLIPQHLPIYMCACMCVCVCYSMRSRQQILSLFLHFLVQVMRDRFHLLQFRSGFVQLIINGR